MSKQPTVFIVDDDQASRESVRALVASMNVQAQLFASAEEFLDAYDPATPGCLVTDLRMLGMSGVELLEQLRARGLQLPAIVMSAFADVPVAVRSMQLGALTLLEKPCRNTELWDAIRKALELDTQRRATEQRQRAIRERLESLSPQERDVLDMIMQGVPNKAIANRLEVSLRTVEARRKNVFQKTGTRTVAELVRLINELE